MQVVEAHVRYTTRCCCLQNAQAGPYSLQIDISTSFRHVFASPRPEIPTPPVNFCICVPLRPHRSSIRSCAPKAHLDFELEPVLIVVSAPVRRLWLLRLVACNRSLAVAAVNRRRHFDRAVTHLLAGGAPGALHTVHTDISCAARRPSSSSAHGCSNKFVGTRTPAADVFSLH